MPTNSAEAPPWPQRRARVPPPPTPHPPHPLPYPHARAHAPDDATSSPPQHYTPHAEGARLALPSCGCRACPGEGRGLPCLGGCFTRPLPSAVSLSGGCSQVVSRGIRLIPAPRGSNLRSRVNPQAATHCWPPNRGFNPKLRPALSRVNLHSTSKLHRAFPGPGRAFQARRAGGKSAPHNSIQLKSLAEAGSAQPAPPPAGLNATAAVTIIAPTRHIGVV